MKLYQFKLQLQILHCEVLQMDIIKEESINQSSKIPQYLDGRTIHDHFKIQQRRLQTTLNDFKKQLLQQYENFRTYLLSSMKNLNYLRYAKSFPDQDIRFVFRDRTQMVDRQDEGIQQKQSIFRKMMRFDVIKEDFGGVSQNCIYELDNYLKSGKNIIKFQQICPSGLTFIQSNQPIIQKYIGFWKDSQDKESDLNSIFKEISPVFQQSQIKKLGQIFSQANKALISAKLIFRASQHNFNSAMFKEICQGRSPTLLLVKSDKDFVFGGYTPCKWLKTKEKEYVSDPSAQSFLFSLNHSMVFPIKKNQLDYAISAYGGWGPIFGSPYGPDLSIADKCHMNDHSCSSLGSHYQIPSKIKQYSNEAFSLLAGAKKFKVVQYEIYEVFVT